MKEDNIQIRLTLFRTYNFMGKENLLYRLGRVSGEKIIETKDAQLLKNLNFKLGFTTYIGIINDSNIDTLAKKKKIIYLYKYMNILIF